MLGVSLERSERDGGEYASMKLTQDLLGAGELKRVSIMLGSVTSGCIGNCETSNVSDSSWYFSDEEVVAQAWKKRRKRKVKTFEKTRNICNDNNDSQVQQSQRKTYH